MSSHSKYNDRPVSDKLRRRAEYMDSERAELIERISQTESLHRRRPATREGPARPGGGLGRSTEGLGRPGDSLGRPGEGPRRPGEGPGRAAVEDFVRLTPYEGWQASSSSGSAGGMQERSCGEYIFQFEPDRFCNLRQIHLEI